MDLKCACATIPVLIVWTVIPTASSPREYLSEIALLSEALLSEMYDTMRLCVVFE